MGKNPALLIKHFPSSKKKGKRLMARKKKKLEERFKEDVFLHVPIRIFFFTFSKHGETSWAIKHLSSF